MALDASVVAAEYTDRFGPLIGVGSVRGFLGDPSKYNFEWAHGCAYYQVASDTHGNPYFIVMRASDHEIYDWQALAGSQFRGYSEAKILFEMLESATLSKSNGIGIGAGFRGNTILQDGGVINGHTGGTYIDFATTAARYATYVGDNRIPIGWTVIGLSPDGTPKVVTDPNHPYDHRSPANPPVLDTGVYQVLRKAEQPRDILLNRLQTVVIIQGYQFWAIVNPILRVGYITGFRYDNNGADSRAIGQAIISTAQGVGSIALGIITDNVVGIVGGAVKIAAGWATYGGTVATYQGQVGAAATKISQVNRQAIECTGITPKPDFFDWLKGLV